jgi:para-nitrobenzyl esterase
MPVVARSLCLAKVMCLCLLASAGAQTHAPHVAISSGALQGLRLQALPRGGVFLGIPFAAQPVGNLRWKAPQPPLMWSGTRKASEFGPACPQFPSPWLPEMSGVQQMATDEACLFLNVWTPELNPTTKLPVFVWVHGGGNVEGAGDWPPLGEALAERGVLVVSLIIDWVRSAFWPVLPSPRNQPTEYPGTTGTWISLQLCSGCART